MNLHFDQNEAYVLLNALEALADSLPEDDEDQPVIAELTARIDAERARVETAAPAAAEVPAWSCMWCPEKGKMTTAESEAHAAEHRPTVTEVVQHPVLRYWHVSYSDGTFEILDPSGVPTADDL